MEGVREHSNTHETVILMKLQRAAFSGIILFGDLNAFSPRQLLILGLDVPDMQAETVESERESHRDCQN